jgi:hypothetical protein
MPGRCPALRIAVCPLRTLTVEIDEELQPAEDGDAQASLVPVIALEVIEFALHVPGLELMEGVERLPGPVQGREPGGGMDRREAC